MGGAWKPPGPKVIKSGSNYRYLSKVDGPNGQKWPLIGELPLRPRHRAVVLVSRIVYFLRLAHFIANFL